MTSDIRLICFYLPQFHPIPENDKWWGKGFTEWTNVVQAKPHYPGHYQPHLPADLGFYDLRVPEVREEQARLASKYGISGFCYHHYWFGGKRLLERPFNEVLASGKPKFPFCLSWANENWTRRWDGHDSHVLIQQQHSDEDDINFIQSLLPAFRDDRYIRINGRPLLIVYRTSILPNPDRTAMIWRDQVKQAGLDDLYLCRAETFTTYENFVDPAEIGFDAALEFPPHATLSVNIAPTLIPADSGFAGQISDYRQVLYHALIRKTPTYRLFRGVMPAWDNTARRHNAATIFMNSSPKEYQRWLTEAIHLTRLQHIGDERLIFINGWNEWAEGCHLEPDFIDGHGYLQATQAALRNAKQSEQLIQECAMQLEGSGNILASDIDSALNIFVENLRKRLDQDFPAEFNLLAELNGSFLRQFVIQHLNSDRSRFRFFRRLIYRTLRFIYRLGRVVGLVR